ncbi:translation factor GUF1 [Skeletonema marinoi]|uniref:Translation factor GUF1 n=1 Tax=Skeletonema marinoi TaxID=267567 RepID=A0AAD9DCE3_9STRA|nr:translation factor GUF1 [Skeletonema marinoi]
MASRLLEYTGNLGHDRQATAHQLGEKTTTAYNQDESSAIIKDNADTSKETGSKSSKHKEIKEEITLLDTLKVERERGITVKASAASMLYKHPSATNDQGWILLNMVDTPGHADFGVEVTRPMEVALAVSDLFAFDPDTIMKTSARNRIGVRELLDSVCENIPPPSPLSDDDGTMLRAKVIDSWFEPRRGVVVWLGCSRGFYLRMIEYRLLSRVLMEKAHKF